MSVHLVEALQSEVSAFRADVFRQLVIQRLDRPRVGNAEEDLMIPMIILVIIITIIFIVIVPFKILSVILSRPEPTKELIGFEDLHVAGDEVS